MNHDLESDLQAACEYGRYPQEFLADYEPFECLANNACGETLLVKNKRTGMFCVAKCYKNGNAASHANEAEILKRLRHTGLPRFVDEYKGDETTCVIREYVEGTPLHQLSAKPGARQAVHIALALCDLLEYLHGQTPPIIHRDIKPQNLIMGTDGQLWLIDFGISRLYREESEKDTACWGTQDFAAPEQYGFQQTDVRSDLYSSGILLGWLLTGEVKREAQLSKITDHRLYRIVKKCTSFAPGERYTSAARLRADLSATDGHRRRRILARAGAAALCALCLCGGFALGRFTDVFKPAVAGVAFAEPLIEQAARLTLGIADGDPVTEQDLLSITELYVYGDQPAGSNEDYQAIMRQADGGGTAANGGIASLTDLAMMPNLSIVDLPLQNIADLSPLAGLAALRDLDIKHNPVSDLTPLSGLSQLTGVGLYGTRAADLSPLAACPLLSSLDVGGTFVTSAAALRGNGSIRWLKLSKAPLQTLAGIEALTSLREIELSEVADGDLTPLLLLPSLEKVTLGEALRSAAEETLSGAGFAIVYE